MKPRKIRKLFLLFIVLITMTGLSYAPFPITDTLELKQDTIKIETVEQYHLRMQKMGFDLNFCNCANCQLGLPIAIDTINSDAAKWYFQGWMPRMGYIFGVANRFNLFPISIE